MATYTVDMTIEVEADSKIEVSDIIREMLDGAPMIISDEVNSDLFAELGVKYD